jgi:hypothetical protein
LGAGADVGGPSLAFVLARLGRLMFTESLCREFSDRNSGTGFAVAWVCAPAARSGREARGNRAAGGWGKPPSGGAWWEPAQDGSPEQVDARSSLERRAAADG